MNTIELRRRGARFAPHFTLSAAALLVCAAALASDSVVTHEFRVSAERGNALRVVIDVPEADMVIENAESPTIDAAGTVSREYRKVSDIKTAQQIVDAAGLRIDVEGSRAIVRRSFGPGAHSRSARGRATRFAFTLRVPRGMHLEIHQKAGEAKIAGSYGNVTVRMRAGDVFLTTPRRLVKELIAATRVGETVTELGDREITNQGVLPERTHFFNEGGSGIVDLHVTVGDIRIKLTE